MINSAKTLNISNSFVTSRKTKLYTPPMGPITNTDNLQLYNKTSQATNGNCKFIREGNGSWRLDYVFNPEGYMRYYGPEEHYAFYYIKDHLGFRLI